MAALARARIEELRRQPPIAAAGERAHTATHSLPGRRAQVWCGVVLARCARFGVFAGNRRRSQFRASHTHTSVAPPVLIFVAEPVAKELRACLSEIVPALRS